MRVLWLVISILCMGLIVLNWNVRRELVIGLSKDKRRYIDRCKGYYWKFPAFGLFSLAGVIFFLLK